MDIACDVLEDGRIAQLPLVGYAWDHRNFDQELRYVLNEVFLQWVVRHFLQYHLEELGCLG